MDICKMSGACSFTPNGWREICDMMNSHPVVNAIKNIENKSDNKVLNCKDCQYYAKLVPGVCSRFGISTSINDYCSFAVKAPKYKLPENEKNFLKAVYDLGFRYAAVDEEYVYIFDDENNPKNYLEINPQSIPEFSKFLQKDEDINIGECIKDES